MDDYNSCCRLCLSSQEDNLYLFGSQCLKELIPQKILCILSILVHPQDTLPQKICPHCFDHVKRFYKFHRTSSCSTEHLLTLLEKDEDVNKNIYANLQKTFQKKNYSNLTGNTNYELLLKEKFNEVKNSMNEVTSKFSIKSTDLISNKIYLLDQSGSNASINMTNINSLERPDSTLSPVPVTNKAGKLNLTKSSTSKKVLGPRSKRIVENNDPREKEDKSMNKCKALIGEIKCDTLLINKSCDNKNKSPLKTGRPKKKIDEERCTENIDIETKVESLKIFRCKYCLCAYPSKRVTFYHEATGHTILVKLNKYYGPHTLTLEEDYINQVKKMSWPFRKKRSSVTMKRKLIPSDMSRVDAKSTSPNVKKSSPHTEDVTLASRLVAKEHEVPTKKIRFSPKCEKNTSKTSYPHKKIDFSDAPIIDVFTKERIFVGPKSKKMKYSKKKYYEYQCKYCKSELDSLASKEFLAHLDLNKCNNVTKHTCCLCREDFSKKTELFDKHKNNCNMAKFKKEIICSKCSISVEKEALKDHLLEQHQVLFKCLICSAEFNQKDCLSDHLMKCPFRPTIVKKFSCETCTKKFPTLISLKTHCLNEHTYNYLNCDVSLNYNNIFDTTVNEMTFNIQQYKIDNYIACNSKGVFSCSIKDCTKVLGTIFQLESHIQSHCKIVRRKGTKRKKKGGKSNLKIKSQTFKKSICDDYLLKKIELEAFASLEENIVEMKPKESFLFYLGLTHNPEKQDNLILDVLTNVFRNDPDKNSSFDTQGIFELSESAKTSDQRLLIWDAIADKSPELLTIDSDDD